MIVWEETNRPQMGQSAPDLRLEVYPFCNGRHKLKENIVSGEGGGEGDGCGIEEVATAINWKEAGYRAHTHTLCVLFQRSIQIKWDEKGSPQKSSEVMVRFEGNRKESHSVAL